MKDIIPAKKESPILGLSGLGGGVGSNIVAGLADDGSKYIDELFNTYTYRGNATARTINTGIDISKNGGLVWLKNRDTNDYNHNLFDTVRGPTKLLNSNATTINTTNANTLTSFNNNGFSIGNDVQVNNNNEDQIAWTFSKRKGFFDIVKYTGDGVSGRTVPHGLGCIPGSIIIKSLDNAYSWFTYHGAVDIYGGAPWTKYLMLNHPNAVTNASWFMYDTAPTATEFTVGHSGNVNAAGSEYVAYIFAGAESTDANATSVRFTDGGASDYLSVPDDPAWDMNNHDFTMECWARFHTHNGHDGIIHNVTNGGWSGGGWIFEPVGGRLFFYYMDNSSTTHSVTGGLIPLGVWQHMAITKSGSTITIYQDGMRTGQGTISTQIRSGTNPVLIGGQCVGSDCDADISNVRITTGQVLYTSSFKPPTTPLTTTSQGATASNVKLLCCNQSTANGYSVSPGAITAYNSPIANTFSPFDDPDCFKFGENEDQQVIKCGSYVGNGNSDGPDVYLGWEPQWLMVKSSLQATEQWHIVDNLRGMVDGYNELHMEASTMNGDLSAQLFRATPRGFKVTTADSKMNNNNGVYIYYAIRRPDPLVQKPAEAATEVFAIDTGVGSSTIPNFDSGFPVDFAFGRVFGSQSNWNTGARLIQQRYMDLNEQTPEASGTAMVYDSNVGWNNYSGWATGSKSWMWKRHAGFDVVTYTGNGQNMYVPHNLNAVPQMMWVKSRTQASSYWGVYHFGLNGGVNPQQYRVNCHDNAAQTSTSFWNSTAPTAEWFSVGNAWTRGSAEKYIAMLFTSVPGISKLGYFTGSNSNVTLDLGFNPRFLLFKHISATANWALFDTTAGIINGSSPVMNINNVNVVSSLDCFITTTNGIIVKPGSNYVNLNGGNFIYYAHA